MMNDYSASETGDKMGVLVALETQLPLSAPQPRTAFETELAQRLRREYVQRSQSQKMLTATGPGQSRRRMRMAALLVAVLTIGVGVVIAMSTVIQHIVQFDAGLQAIFDQGLGHEVGISQSHEGFTVTLEWAYADGNRLTLAYIIQGIPGTQYTNLASDVYRLTVRDTGEEIPFSQGMSIPIDQNGEVFDWRIPQDTIVTFDRRVSVWNYHLDGISLEGRTTLDLRLELEPYGITLQRRTQLPIEQFNDMKEGPEARFILDFSIAVVDDQRIMDTSQMATDQGIALTLEQVRVSPSQTRVLVCFVPPDPARDWTAIAHLSTSGGDVAGGGGVRPYMDEDRSCQDYTYFSGMFDYTGEWRLEISELVGFGDGGGNDQQRLPGSWVFEFVVP